jgi:hypothetical protein
MTILPLLRIVPSPARGRVLFPYFATGRFLDLDCSRLEVRATTRGNMVISMEGKDSTERYREG